MFTQVSATHKRQRLDAKGGDNKESGLAARARKSETFFAMLFTKIKSCKLKLTAIMHLESEREHLTHTINPDY